MKVTVIPIVNGALGTNSSALIKWLEDLEIRGKIDTIQNIALLKSARIPRRVLETWGDTKTGKYHQLMAVWKTLKGVKQW